MGLETLIAFLSIIALATYVQTITGFALGMIVMGAVTTFDLAPIAFTSVIISAVHLTNGLFVLNGNYKALDLKRVMITCAGIFPGLVVGLILLNYLSDAYNSLLQMLLGLTIIVGGLMIMLKPEPLQSPSRPATFTVSGTAAGLFSMTGPPLVYLFYRQPFELKTVRLCLQSIFLISSVSRTVIVGFQGGLTLDMLTFSLGG